MAKIRKHRNHSSRQGFGSRAKVGKLCLREDRHPLRDKTRDPAHRCWSLVELRAAMARYVGEYRRGPHISGRAAAPSGARTQGTHGSVKRLPKLGL